MAKTLFLVFLISVLVGFVFWPPSAHPEEPDVNASDEESTVGFESESFKSDILEDKPFFSTNPELFDDIQNVNAYKKTFFDKYDTLCLKTIKQHEDLVITINNYVQRYVSLFLITSNLLEYEIKDSDEMITVDLEVSISKDDLAYLQNYSKNTKDSPYPNNFSKLNAIFSNIAKLKEKSYAENAMSSFKVFLSGFNIYSVFNSPSFYHFFPLLVIFSIICTIGHSFYRVSFYSFIGMIINSLILWESLHLYWKRIKEVDTEIYVKTLQLRSIPKECNPASLKWYHSVLNLFREDKCLEYFKNLNKNPVEEVFLLQCIIDTYSYYFIQTPLKVLGASIRDFTGEISAIWPRWIRWLITVPLVPSLTVFVLLLVLVLFGKRLRLSFFGAAVEIGDVKSITTSSETPKAIRVMRKLKPWTKSRFPKRSESDLAKRRKLYLKASKSVSEMPVNSSIIFNDIETQKE